MNPNIQYGTAIGFRRSTLAGWLMLVLLGCWVSAAHAGDDGKSGAAKGKGKSRPTVSERPQVLSSGAMGAMQSAENARLITEFQAARSRFLETQKELSLKMKEATEDQRALLRASAKEALDQWREEQRHFVEEQKERARQMKQELHPEFSLVVDGAGDRTDGGRGR